MSPMLLGSDPNSRLLDKRKLVRDVRSPIVLGMVPDNRELSNHKSFNNGSVPTLLGIVPLMIVFRIDMNVILRKLPIEVGNVPCSPKLYILIESMLP